MHKSQVEICSGWKINSSSWLHSWFSIFLLLRSIHFYVKAYFKAHPEPHEKSIFFPVWVIKHLLLYFLKLSYIGLKHFWSGSYCVCVRLLTLVSEGGGGRGRGDRGSRCGDGTLANRLLHDTLPVWVVHHIFYRDVETRGEKMQVQTMKDKNRGMFWGNRKKEEEETPAGRGVWRRMWWLGEGGGGKSISEAFYWINIIAQPSAW